ncbi:metal-dependent hydrolase [Corynebacterium sp. HMSC075D04]|uniref:M48 metallopeptidase family protein n=1 Tax=unclassified Corynebacterium TaxID=2624378 RepID=UPI0008A2DD82|nr:MULTISPECIES: SprT-like domain-containing protein [unclassified Corynebacterium]OFL91323.1 metal-dependent hydrolase [Corynebacterium sp. HMSC055D05]OFO34452.1 metal-dependent hydrolase [Corynebacterium sp. HMSC075D04]
MSGMQYRVIRSARRAKTVQARVVGGVAEIRIPAHFTKAQEREMVEQMLTKLEKKTSTRLLDDDSLRTRAETLNKEILQGRATIGSVRWVSNQNTRWGSCTVSTGDIRISDRLRDVPAYVLDAVLVHELTHTFIPNHSKEFYAWADRVPKAERARGFLEAYQRYG